jgi:hypothetical protein
MTPRAPAGASARHAPFRQYGGHHHVGSEMAERTPAYIVRQQRDAKRTAKLVKRQARRVEKRQLKSERRGRR